MQGAAAVGDAIRDGARTMKAALPNNVSVAEALAKAREIHQGGRFADARAICYEILNADPANGEALDLLAESAMVAKMPLMAVECLEQAVAAHPASAKYNSHLGQAWLAAGRADDAAGAWSARWNWIRLQARVCISWPMRDCINTDTMKRRRWPSMQRRWMPTTRCFYCAWGYCWNGPASVSAARCIASGRLQCGRSWPRGGNKCWRENANPVGARQGA